MLYNLQKVYIFCPLVLGKYYVQEWLSYVRNCIFCTVLALFKKKNDALMCCFVGYEVFELGFPW